MACVVNQAVEAALRDGAKAFEAKGLLVLPVLTASREPSAPAPAVYQAVYTVFRSVPARASLGTVVRVSTRDLTGGGIELTWELDEDARLAPPERAVPRRLLQQGPYGDLLDIAVEALEQVCRARTGYVERHVDTVLPSSSAFARPATFRRRFTAVLPTEP